MRYYIVFYNGTGIQPVHQTLKLSDSFCRKLDQPELELTVTVYNINWGCNQELLDACQVLGEYAQYVEQVRTFARNLPFPEAVEQAVDFCIRNGILKDFLLKNRAEAIEMSIFEYNEEQYLKSEREVWRNEGIECGKKLGREEGVSEGLKAGRKEEGERFSRLMQLLLKEKREDDMNRAIFDSAYREELYRKNDL